MVCQLATSYPFIQGMNSMKRYTKKYEYVRLQVDKNNRAMNADMESHREIIDRTATAGARYVAWLPVTQAIQARPWSST